VNSRATPQGCPFEMLEPRDGKLSRWVLRGEWGRKAPALPGRYNNMIENIEKYLSRQESIVRELKKRSVDLWRCNEQDVLGWDCYSHGEHICCVETNTGAQVEIPLLTAKSVGIDAGHFSYFLETIGIKSPLYAEMHDILKRLEHDGVLTQVQTNDVPIVWDLVTNKKKR